MEISIASFHLLFVHRCCGLSDFAGPIMNTFLILALATWRISSLVANEEGPFKIFTRVRDLVPDNHFKEGLLCEWCCSIWFGSLITLAWYFLPKVELFLLPLALSTITIIIKHVVQTLALTMEHLEAK